MCCKDIEFKDKCQFQLGIVNVISKRLSCFRVAGLIAKVPFTLLSYQGLIRYLAFSMPKFDYFIIYNILIVFMRENNEIYFPI